MKILFLTRSSYPNVGGVEKHVEKVRYWLDKAGHEVKVVSEADIKYPHIKFLGLAYIWYWLLINRKLIKDSDAVHCHDVFIWYLPFRFLFPRTAVFTTFHGWEGVYPVPWMNKFQKKLASKLSNGTIAIGDYIEKYYGVTSDLVIYGGIDKPKKKAKKIKNYLVYLGRLEKDTGLTKFLKFLKSSKRKYKVHFVGDGPLEDECRKYGEVHGKVDPEQYLARAEICGPGGYLSYIESFAYGCKIKLFWDNPLKRDYWKGISNINSFPSWKEVADEYIGLYNTFK